MYTCFLVERMFAFLEPKLTLVLEFATLFWAFDDTILMKLHSWLTIDEMRIKSAQSYANMFGFLQHFWGWGNLSSVFSFGDQLSSFAHVSTTMKMPFFTAFKCWMIAFQIQYDRKLDVTLMHSFFISTKAKFILGSLCSNNLRRFWSHITPWTPIVSGVATHYRIIYPAVLFDALNVFYRQSSAFRY